jgi:hypothetical protein
MSPVFFHGSIADVGMAIWLSPRAQPSVMAIRLSTSGYRHERNGHPGIAGRSNRSEISPCLKRSEYNGQLAFRLEATAQKKAVQGCRQMEVTA